MVLQWGDKARQTMTDKVFLNSLANDRIDIIQKLLDILSRGGIDLRIQIQTDERYNDFISRASKKKMLGYDMYVASIEDVLQGKVWAYSDDSRRKSKRQKDLADIFRIIETYPHMIKQLPGNIKQII